MPPDPAADDVSTHYLREDQLTMEASIQRYPWAVLAIRAPPP